MVFKYRAMNPPFTKEMVLKRGSAVKSMPNVKALLVFAAANVASGVN